MELESEQMLEKILAYMRENPGWCTIRKLSESLPIPRPMIVEIVIQLVKFNQIVKEEDVNTKKNWYHLPEKSPKKREKVIGQKIS